MGMPKGLIPRIAELGKIKIGTLGQERTARSGSKWRPPMKLDRFIVTGCVRDADGRLIIDEKLMTSLIEAHGDPDRKLRSIPIYLLSDDIDDVVRCRYTLYTGKHCEKVCDGITCTTLRRGNEKLENPIQSECTGEHEGNGWKIQTTLSCVIASDTARFGGYYIFRSTSKITASQVYGSLLSIQQLTHGVLSGVPLWLCVCPLAVAPDGKPTTVYVVHIELRGESYSAIQAQSIAVLQHRQTGATQIEAARREYTAMLRAPGDEPDEEQEEIAEEFHPYEEQRESLGALLDDDRRKATEAIGAFKVKMDSENAQDPTPAFSLDGDPNHIREPGEEG